MRRLLHVLCLVTLIALPMTCAHAQISGGFEYALSPHGAEAIRLGGGYVGVGRGLASMHANTASLAFQPGVQVMYTTGRSLQWLAVDLTSAYDVAAAVHIPQTSTTVGVEYNHDAWEFEVRDEGNNPLGTFGFDDQRLSIHVAQRIAEWLGVGVAVRNYTSKLSQVGTARETASIDADQWEMSISAHARHAASFLGRPDDELRYGITLDKALGSDGSYTLIDAAQPHPADPMQQMLRVGLGYFWYPAVGRMFGLDALQVLGTAEMQIEGKEYEFGDYQGFAAGVELRIAEVLLLSAGTQTRNWTGEGNEEWSAYPALRYGVGLDLPFDRLLKARVPLALRFDFGVTSWNGDATDLPMWDDEDRGSKDTAISIHLVANVL